LYQDQFHDKTKHLLQVEGELAHQEGDHTRVDRINAQDLPKVVLVDPGLQVQATREGKILVELHRVVTVHPDRVEVQVPELVVASPLKFQKILLLVQYAREHLFLIRANLKK
jgi:hypothetical protein